jgi:hypothetical protein
LIARSKVNLLLSLLLLESAEYLKEEEHKLLHLLDKICSHKREMKIIQFREETQFSSG